MQLRTACVFRGSLVCSWLPKGRLPRHTKPGLLWSGTTLLAPMAPNARSGKQGGYHSTDAFMNIVLGQSIPAAEEVLLSVETGLLSPPSVNCVLGKGQLERISATETCQLEEATWLCKDGAHWAAWGIKMQSWSAQGAELSNLSEGSSLQDDACSWSSSPQLTPSPPSVQCAQTKWHASSLQQEKCGPASASPPLLPRAPPHSPPPASRRRQLSLQPPPSSQPRPLSAAMIRLLVQESRANPHHARSFSAPCSGPRGAAADRHLAGEGALLRTSPPHAWTVPSPPSSPAPPSKQRWRERRGGLPADSRPLSASPPSL